MKVGIVVAEWDDEHGQVWTQEPGCTSVGAADKFRAKLDWLAW